MNIKLITFFLLRTLKFAFMNTRPNIFDTTLDSGINILKKKKLKNYRIDVKKC